ncbi:hypothetical protein AA219_004655, partial [Salmonella enterica subsp. enterica serovar Newport]|nr:hypothetical protein [Salmonella enterica subsp. enterica serovar Newport]
MTITTEGDHALSASASDVAGNTSALSSAVHINFDITPPNTPAITVSNGTHGLLDGDSTNANTWTVNGTGNKGDTVKLYDNGTLI